MQLRQLTQLSLRIEERTKAAWLSNPCSSGRPFTFHSSSKHRSRQLHVVGARRGRPRNNPVDQDPSADSLADASWGDAFGKAKKQPKAAAVEPPREAVQSKAQAADADFGREDDLGDLGEEGEEAELDMSAADEQLPPKRQPGAASSPPPWAGEQQQDGYEWDDDVEEFAEEAEEGDIAGLELAQQPTGETAASTTAADLVLSQDLELEQMRIDIGDDDVDGPVPAAAWVDIYTKPRFDMSPGPAIPGDAECRDLMFREEDIENLPPEKVEEMAFKLIVEQRWREEWDFEEYMEQMFEVQSQHWKAKNKYAQILRLAEIMNKMRVQDDFLPADVDLTNRPNMARAFLVFDREFKWFDRTYDVESHTRMSQEKFREQDLLRYRSEFEVTREFAEKGVTRIEDPLAGLIADVLPGASLEAMEQPDYLQDVLPTESEVVASDVDVL